jgi:hypothetical protein
MVNYIEIGGKKRPLYFGMNGIRKFCKAYNIDLQHFADAFTTLGMDKAIHMIAIALEEGARKENKPAEYTVETVADYFDENFDSFGEATQAIMENLPFKTEEEKKAAKTEKTTEGNAPKQIAKS